MARLATWTMAATVLLGGLAGCIGKPPEDIETPPIECSECCGDCHPTTWRTPPTLQPAYDCGIWDPNVTKQQMMLCDVDWPRPTFEPFDARLLWPACDGCASPAIATRSDGALVVATERGLVIADATRTERIEAPMLARAAPSVAVDREGRAWYAALHHDGAVPSVFLGAWLGAEDEWTSTDVLDVTKAPLLLATTHVDVAALPDGLVVVLSSGEGAWAVRYDGTFRAPERLTPLGGTALVGAPASDAKGRVMVPFAFTPHASGGTTAPILPPYPSTSLHYATLGTVGGAWSTHGGAIFAHGVTRAPAIEMDRGVPGALVFVDAADNVERVETWDAGGSWGSPTPWSEARATSAAAATRAEHRATLAWWETTDEDEVRLVVARSDGGLPIERQTVALAEGQPRASLAKLGDGRAALVWSDKEGVWATVEGAWPDTRCDDNAHCTQGLW